MVPSNLTIGQTEKPSAALLEDAVQLFLKLMKDDTGALSLTGGNVELLPDLIRAMINATALWAGEMYTAIDETGTLVAYTLWIPPGHVAFESEEQRQLGFYKFMEKLSEGKEYYERVLGVEFPKFVDESFGIPQAVLNTYWCSFAMVREDYQNKGLTTTMFDMVYEKARKLGTVMTLSTGEEKTSNIYQSMGFELKGFRVMPSPWKDWPSYVLMRRTASS